MNGQASQIHRHWNDVTFEQVPSPALATSPYLEALSAIYDRALVAQFTVPDRAQWDAYLESMWRPQWDFTLRLLDSDAFHAALPELEPHAPTESPFEQLSPFYLAGDFTRALCQGGAYEKVEDTGTAEHLSNDLVQRLLDGRRINTNVLLAENAWNSWFYDVAWDRTWLVLDWQAVRITFIAATATD